MIEGFLRVLWIIFILLVFGGFGYDKRVNPTVLIDKSYSSRVVFGDNLDKYGSFFKEKGFKVITFGSDTISDIGGAIKGAECPCILISDGINNSQNDPVASSLNKGVFVIIPPSKELKPFISGVYMRTPPTVGGSENLRVEFSGCLNDTVYLRFKGSVYKRFACESAEFSLSDFSEKDSITIKTDNDSLRFFTFGIKSGKTAFLVWKPLPFVRFLRGKFPDAEVILKRDNSIEGDYNLMILVSPPDFNPNLPSIVVVGDNTRGFRKVKGRFFIRGDVPPLSEIYVPSFKLDRVYEMVGDYPLIGFKGKSLLILSPDLWKVWLADRSFFSRFSNYIDENLKVLVDVWADRPVYFYGEVAKVFISGYGIDKLSINGKSVGFDGLYTYSFEIKDTGRVDVDIGFYKGKEMMFKRRVSFYALGYPVEKRRLGVDTALLKTIAEVSGGKVLWDTSQIGDIKVFTKRRSIYDYPFLFLLFSLLMLAEWGIRRYKGKV
ncbi:MAG: hypothetical protein ABIL16_07620 [candidate division WOR-3 bacterium]